MTVLDGREVNICEELGKRIRLICRLRYKGCGLGRFGFDSSQSAEDIADELRQVLATPWHKLEEKDEVNE